MLSDRLDICNSVELTAAASTGAGRGRAGLCTAAAVLALAAYTGATGWILSTNTARVYGFPISHDPRTVIEIAMQVCPMLAAIFLVLLAPVSERLTESLARRVQPVRPSRRTAMTVAVSAGSAIVTVGATAGAVAGVCGFRAAAPGAATLLWVAGELMFDVALIGVFITTLHALTRRLWATVLLFLLYIVTVSVVGPLWGITSYIGFGSSVPVMLTTYSTAPLYDGAAWLLRGYWLCVTLVMLSIRYGYDCPPLPLLRTLLSGLRAPERRWRGPLGVSLALIALCILAGSSLLRLQRYGTARYQPPSQASLDTALLSGREEARLHLTHFNVRLSYAPDERKVAVEGDLTFSNETQPIHTAYFQMPGLMIPDRIEFQGVGKYKLRALGKYIQVTFAETVPPRKQVRAVYSGSIEPAGAFDLAVQAKVLPGRILPERLRYPLDGAPRLLSHGFCLDEWLFHLGELSDERSSGGQHYGHRARAVQRSERRRGVEPPTRRRSHRALDYDPDTSPGVFHGGLCAVPEEDRGLERRNQDPGVPVAGRRGGRSGRASGEEHPLLLSERLAVLFTA